MNGYGIFLMIELARIAGIIPKDLEYDEIWGRGEKLHKEFESSKFNDTYNPEYECMEEFLKDYKKENVLVPMPTKEQLIPFCYWYKTTDFNCEGHSSEDCVNEYLKNS